jgi:hypothetical protein
MGITVSILMIAAGAILRWAVSATADGFNIQTIGLILFIVGIVGALLSLAFWSSWGGFRRSTTVVEDSTIVDDRRVVR